MCNADFAQNLLEKIGGNSATIVLDASGFCVFASGATDNVLKISAGELQGKKFVDAVPLYTMEDKLVDELKNPIAKALAQKDFTQSTPFFCKLAADESAESLALRVIKISGGEEGEYIVLQ